MEVRSSKISMILFLADGDCFVFSVYCFILTFLASASDGLNTHLAGLDTETDGIRGQHPLHHLRFDRDHVPGSLPDGSLGKLRSYQRIRQVHRSQGDIKDYLKQHPTTDTQDLYTMDFSNTIAASNGRNNNYSED